MIEQVDVSVLREVGGTVVFYSLLAAACWLYLRLVPPGDRERDW